MCRKERVMETKMTASAASGCSLCRQQCERRWSRCVDRSLLITWLSPGRFSLGCRFRAPFAKTVPVKATRAPAQRELQTVFFSVRVFPFQKNLKYLDPSYKTDLDLWDSFGRETSHFIAELQRSVVYIYLW